MSVGAFDIDGTILHHPGRPDYLNPEVLAKAVPDLDVCRRIRSLIEAGQQVHFITGRSHAVKEFTVSQLRACVHQGIQPEQVHTQAEFVGYDVMAAWKGTILKNMGASWYVGDHSADYEASQIAGIPFQHASKYSAASKTWRLG